MRYIIVSKAQIPNSMVVQGYVQFWDNEREKVAAYLLGLGHLYGHMGWDSPPFSIEPSRTVYQAIRECRIFGKVILEHGYPKLDANSRHHCNGRKGQHTIRSIFPPWMQFEEGSMVMVADKNDLPGVANQPQWSERPSETMGRFPGDDQVFQDLDLLIPSQILSS